MPLSDKKISVHLGCRIAGSDSLVTAPDEQVHSQVVGVAKLQHEEVEVKKGRAIERDDMSLAAPGDNVDLEVERILALRQITLARGSKLVQGRATNGGAIFDWRGLK